MCCCARLAASDERCGVFCTKLRVRGAFQCAKLCRGVQGIQVRCGASGSVARCNGDAVACNKVGMLRADATARRRRPRNSIWCRGDLKRRLRPLATVRQRAAPPAVDASCAWARTAPVWPQPHEERPRPVGAAPMTLQRSPQRPRAKGRVSAAMERRNDMTSHWAAMVSTNQRRR